MNNLIKNWFGERFYELSPQIQHIHIYGGKLKGEINIEYGKGIYGIIGKIIGKKLNLSKESRNHIEVDIYCEKDSMIWSRKINGIIFKSSFTPIRNIDDGYIIEKTGLVKIILTVDIIEGSWHWVVSKYNFLSFDLSPFFLPKISAHKKIKGEKYFFCIAIYSPISRRLILKYHGDLDYKKTSH